LLNEDVPFNEDLPFQFLQSSALLPDAAIIYIS
jgi:hypothetical protein